MGIWHSPVGGQRTDILGGLMTEICTGTQSDWQGYSLLQEVISEL